jgi:hypothetical protein
LIQLTGTVLPKVAIMELTQAGAPANSGATYALGNLPQTISFLIRNTGTDVLRPSAEVLSGEVQFLTAPAAEVAPGESTSLVLLFASATSGVKTAEISILSNDPNRADIRLALTGTSVLPSSGARGVNLGQSGGGTGWQPGSGGEVTVTGGANNSQSYLEAIYQGPGLLSWSWKTQVQKGNDALICLINGVEVVRISSKTAAWEDQVATLPEGICTVRWVYTKDAVSWTGQDRVWLSGVTYRPFEGPRLTMSQWMSAMGLPVPQGGLRPASADGEGSGASTLAEAAQSRVGGGLPAMVAFLGGVDPVRGPKANEYIPIVAAGKCSYRYGISKQSTGGMQQRPIFSTNLNEWSHQGISQKVVEEDAQRIVVEVSVPLEQSPRGFYRVQAWGDPN